MANGKNGALRNIDMGNGCFYKGRHIKPDEWLCPNPTCQHSTQDPRGFYVCCKNDHCPVCSVKMPKKPKYFKDSDWAKPAAGGAGGGGGGAGGGKGGGKGAGAKAKPESPQDKKLRELREKKKQQQQQQDNRKKQEEIDRLEAELGQDSETMEVDDAASGDVVSMEKLEQAMHRREKDLKYWQSVLSDLKKEGETDDEAQAGHDRAKDLFEKARQAWWDSKDPHEQMSKKSSKSDRLHRKVVSMEKEVAEHMEEKLLAEQKAEECQTKIDMALDEIDETKAEIQKLLEESHTIREKMVGSTPEGIGELVDKQCAITLGMFDDPLVSTDECVRAKRPEVVQLTNTVGEALKALALITSQIKGGLDQATKKAAAEAEKSAADTKEKEKTLANAQKAADVVKSKAERKWPVGK